jgi:hypothetical protein
MSIDPSAHRGAGESATFVWIEEPDIVTMRPVGTLLPEHLGAHAAVKRQLAEKIGYTFTRLDFSATTGVAVESRRAALKYASIAPSRAVAVTGANYHITVVASALARGVDALLKLQRPVRFFLSDADAYAWFSELRSRPDSTTIPRPR